MTLSDIDIERAIDHGELVVDPLEPSNVQPSSVDLRLGGQILIPVHRGRVGSSTVDVTDRETYPTYNPEREDLTVPAQRFVLATTKERVELPAHLKASIEGRSSVGRLGLFVENAGLLDAGFCGQVTLELVNPTPYDIKLEEGMRICQMVVDRHETPADVGYSEKEDSKYSDQSGPTPSRLYDDFTDD